MSRILSNDAWDEIINEHYDRCEARLIEIAEFCRELDRDYLRYTRENYGFKEGEPLRVKLPKRFQK